MQWGISTRILKGVGAIVILFWAWQQLQDPQRFPIRNVQVEGNYPHLPPILLQQTLNPYVSEGFFAIDLEVIRARLQSQAWIGRVSIHRHWPDRILIHIWEKQPVAYWGTGALISVEGEIFKPGRETFPVGLPVLQGPEDQSHFILESYQKMEQAFKNRGYHIQALTLVSNAGWELKMAEGPLLRFDDMNAHESLQRFLQLYPKLCERRVPATVDLRYRNGLAVRYHTNQE